MSNQNQTNQANQDTGRAPNKSKRNWKADGVSNRPFAKLDKSMFPASEQQSEQRSHFYNAINRPDVDGKDHINIYRTGETKLGRFLVEGSDFAFTDPRFGYFANVEAFSWWLRSVDHQEEFRFMKGSEAYKFSKTIKVNHFLPNFRYFILQATYQKIISSPHLHQAMYSSELPFVRYYYLNDVMRNGAGVNARITPPVAEWFVPGMEEIRKALHETRAPDFSAYIDDQKELDLIDAEIAESQKKFAEADQQKRLERQKKQKMLEAKKAKQEKKQKAQPEKEGAISSEGTQHLITADHVTLSGLPITENMVPPCFTAEEVKLLEELDKAQQQDNSILPQGVCADETNLIPVGVEGVVSNTGDTVITTTVSFGINGAEAPVVKIDQVETTTPETVETPTTDITSV